MILKQKELNSKYYIKIKKDWVGGVVDIMAFELFIVIVDNQKVGVLSL